MKHQRSLLISLAVLLMFFGLISVLQQGNTGILESHIAHANGYIDFEDGIDGQPIQSTIPGLKFTTTNGQDWIYGDWRTGYYHGKYPAGQYTSNGNFFAWLGPYQGDGRIDFTQGRATYISFGVSTANYVTVAG